MNKEEIRQALIKFDREDLLFGNNDIYLDDDVEVFLTISQMIKFNNQQKKIDQLTNNWNELEKWVKEKRDYYDRNDEYSNFRAYADELDDVLDKMKEIKGE